MKGPHQPLGHEGCDTYLSSFRFHLRDMVKDELDPEGPRLGLGNRSLRLGLGSGKS